MIDFFDNCYSTFLDLSFPRNVFMYGQILHGILKRYMHSHIIVELLCFTGLETATNSKALRNTP